MRVGATRLWLAVLFISGLISLPACDAGAGGSTNQESTGESPTRTAGAVPSAGGAGIPAVQDLERILASGPTFQEIRSNSTTVLIDTRIPVVCAAAYGTTAAYGQLATDSDMAGGAHSNHHPLLSGLQTDTEYHVRLQGIGADGTLYRSRDYTFRTPTSDPSASRPEGTNLALLSKGARLVGVSSNYGGGDNSGQYGADRAFDGDPSTQWSSNGDGNKAWVEVELASPAHITSVGLWTRTMGSSAQIFSFQVLADDGRIYGPFKLEDAGAVHYFPVGFTTKKLRFEAIDTSGGNTGAVEIEVYGKP